AQRAEVERRRALTEKGAFPPAELKKLEDNLAILEQNAAVARSERDEAQSIVQSRRTGIMRREVKAPFAGLVVQRNVTVGASVGPQNPIVVIVDESTLEFVAHVAEQRVGAIAVNDVARITLDAYPDHPMAARVREVGNLVDRDTRTVQVKLAIEDSDAVLPS